MAVNSKLIAKNTVYMYIRLLVTIPMAFYTSRVVLQQLGDDNFGIYQAVAGTITMFAVLRGAFDSAAQRYYNYALAKGDNNYLSQIFSACIVIHVVLAFLLILLIYCFGQWFIGTKMQYPPGSEKDVYFVFYTMIVSIAFIIFTIPFTGMVIAREHIQFYASISILDVVLKLILVLLLIFINNDKLRVYAIFQMSVSILLFLITAIYFVIHFRDVRLSKFSKKDFSDLTSFSSWGLLGNICYALVTEGVNLLLNVFGGVVANTARGIAFQVRGVITNILTSTLTAVRPQATQLFIKTDYTDFWKLIYSYSKYIFLIASIMVLPIIFYARPILQLWLGHIPEYSCLFLQLIMGYSLVRSFHEPIDIIFKASGRMKTYQLTTICISSLTFFLSWIALHYDYPLYSPFVIFTVIEGILLYALLMKARKEGISMHQYLNLVIKPCFIYLSVTAIISIIIYWYINAWLLAIVLTIISNVILALIIGLNSTEREQIKSIVIAHLRNK